MAPSVAPLRVGNHEHAAVGHSHLAAVAGLTAPLRVEHRSIQLNAGLTKYGDTSIAGIERCVFAEQLISHGLSVAHARGHDPSNASLARQAVGAHLGVMVGALWAAELPKRSSSCLKSAVGPPT